MPGIPTCGFSTVRAARDRTGGLIPAEGAARPSAVEIATGGMEGPLRGMEPQRSAADETVEETVDPGARAGRQVAVGLGQGSGALRLHREVPHLPQVGE